MFRFFRGKSKNTDLTFSQRQAYLSILTKISQHLQRLGFNEHAVIVQGLMGLIQKDQIDLFIKRINGVDMWGGSGAVWEIYVENEVEAKEFERDMISLIDLMEETNIVGYGIKPIRRIFLSK